ncbi:hypothetical protein H2199_007994 [Coniosporium tulheliwenetii]|uniref:Uncharacterized protein n=1 Tax=Coniosporium tulheliwenetii TaxID=3383036 RepID=A0ACC2YLS9_9PEZI|nr:hypothetical protein H2199_007994 [Cladosporium sp. JES 115]
MAAPGFFISIDNQTDTGVRNNICSTSTPWWANQSIGFGGTRADTATVDQPVTIQVQLRGTPGPPFVRSRIDTVQAWATYPNTIGGRSAKSLIVPSMQEGNPDRQTPPYLESAVFCTSGPPDADPATGVSVPAPLTPAWTPQARDLVRPNTQAHCCIVVTASGVFGDEETPDGESIGDDELSYIDICNKRYQGQRNVFINPAAQNRISGSITPVNFGFLSGHAIPDRGLGRFTIDIIPLPQREGIDPAIHRILASSDAYKGLPLKASTTPVKSIKLGKNRHPPGEYLEKITVEAEKIAEDVVPDFEKLFGLEGAGVGQATTGMGTRLHLSTKGLTNLLLEAELSEKEEVGAVHVFDVVQTDQESGERGGIRIAAVVVEGKGKPDSGEVAT